MGVPGWLKDSRRGKISLNRSKCVAGEKTAMDTPSTFGKRVPPENRDNKGATVNSAARSLMSINMIDSK